jgi:hypothetical protein
MGTDPTSIMDGIVGFELGVVYLCLCQNALSLEVLEVSYHPRHYFGYWIQLEISRLIGWPVLVTCSWR